MNWQFVDREFAGMMYSPARVPEGESLFKIYPELKKYKIFTKSAGPGLDNDKVMMWILCMYDKNTPYRAKYRDVLRRKAEIAHDVGFETLPSGIFEDPVEDFMRGNNKIVNEKGLEFVRMHRSFKYAYMVAIENSYYNMLLEVMNGNTKRIADLRGVQEELEETMLQLLNEDDNPYMKDAVLRYMEEERLMLRPEDIARKKASGEDPVPDKKIL